MKITTLLLIAVILHVSAATSLAQKVTLNEKNVALVDVFNKIRVQTGYDFAFSTETLENSKPVTIDVKNQELTDVLTKIFRGQNLEFSLNNKIVTVKPKEENLIDKAKAFFAQVTISGKVQDETGQPMMGVTVKIKDSNIATATDKNGSYSLTVPDDKTIISFTFIGYEPQEFRAKDIPNGTVITLKAAAQNLKEVTVNFGYYQTSKELSTGASSRITAEDIEKQPVSNPIQTLEGRIPGLSISQTSGVPGASFKIQLRGQNSIASGNDPLYIIDGVPFTSTTLSSSFILNNSALLSPSNDPTNGIVSSSLGLSPFNSLNPSDIESIEVLKDADATAIYGSRGGNGVILITTKKGKAGQTRIDVNVNSGDGQVASKLHLLNTQQYLAMRHEAFKNDGKTPDPSSDRDINGKWDTTRYTDWQKAMIGGTAHFTNAQANISGGNANTQFLLGGAYSNQTTVFPGDYFDRKASAHISLNHKSTNNKFNAVFSAQYLSENNVVPPVDFTQFITLAPDAPALRNPDGSLNFQNNTWTNPLGYLGTKNSSVTSNLMGNLNLAYQILPGLKIQSSFGYTRVQMNQSDQVRIDGFYPGVPDPNNRFNFWATSNFNSWIIEPQINYNKTFGKGKLDVLVGTTIQQQSQNSIGYAAVGFLSDAQVSNVFAASFSEIAGNYSTDYRYNALYARLNYNFDDKYVINATGRRDGSSRFGPSEQFGNFGAVGAALIFSNENFIKKLLPFLSFGKLRASYGTTGNDQIQDYGYLSAYANNKAYQGVAGLIPNKIANPYFGWERNNKLEGGLELGFLSDRVHIEADYYRNRTGNQLVGYPLPYIAGFTTVQANLPAIVQNTGLEFVLNTVNIRSKEFNWSSSFNISAPRNKLVAFPNIAGTSYATTYIVGQPLFIQDRIHYTEVNPQTGIYTYQDVNNDGQISNPADAQFLKQIAVNYFGGFQNTFSYKNWSLDVFFQFVKQTGFDYTAAFAAPGTYNVNQPVFVLSRWTQPGDQTSVEKFTTDHGNSANTGALGAYRLQNTDRSITDASFIRLKNVALSYNLPKAWLQKIHVQNIRIYLQAQNLITITDYKGLDPETQGLSLPPLRMITAGFNVSL